MIRTPQSNPLAPRFQVLSNEQCNEIFSATLECLQRVGVKVQNATGRDLLAAAGATVNGEIVHIPAEAVKRAISTTPRQFTVYGRDPSREMRVSLEHVYFGPGPTCTYFLDPASGQRRKAQRGDAGLTAKVCDALPNINYIMGLSLFDDVPPVLSPVYEFAEELENTTKPIICWANTPATMNDIYQMAVAVAGSESAFREKPNTIFFTTYESPLKLAHDPIANLLFAADHGIPAICLGGPTVGSEAPFTGASALVIHLAAALAALTLVQLKYPGAPFVIGGVPSMMDVRSGRPAYGSPEMSLHSAAAMDVARWLGIPFMGTAGASEAKQLDAQAGVEGTLEVLLSALSGASLVHDVGFFDCADIGSLEYLVLTDEIISMATRVMRGIKIDAETIMMDLIAKVGPGGSFMAEGKSAGLCRAEAWVPTVLDRNPYAVWEKKGAKTTAAIVGEKLQKILSNHRPAPLAAEVVSQIDQILKAAEKRENERRG
jgi:trimethylamine--corrinoid protein Co-methyltransferase